MGTAWTYEKDQEAEYLTIRTKAGVMEVSGLKKVHITGAHASHVIDRATTRDVEKITPGRASYACNGWITRCNGQSILTELS